MNSYKKLRHNVVLARHTTTQATEYFSIACDVVNSLDRAGWLDAKMQDYDQNAVYAPVHAHIPHEHFAQASALMPHEA